MTTILRKLDQTILSAQDEPTTGARYKNADALIGDLLILEKALSEAKSEALAVDVTRRPQDASHFAARLARWLHPSLE